MRYSSSYRTNPHFAGEWMSGRASLLAVSLLAGVLVGCGHRDLPRPTAAQVAPTLSGDPAHPDRTSGWVDTRLYFGLGPGISEARWREFLDREVTPRFPHGLSALDVYGQWQGNGQAAPERLRSKVLVIDYADTPENRDKVEDIRRAWKAMTGDQSVMRVTQPADVSF
jgi:Protein of unknown function (DUF3574)